MLDVNILRNEPERVAEALRKRHARVDLEPFLKLDADRRAAIYQMEQLRAEQNRANEAIARARRVKQENTAFLPANALDTLRNTDGGVLSEADEAIVAMRKIKDRAAALEERVRELDAASREFLLVLPNLPDVSVPEGADAADNPVARVWGEPPAFDFEPKDHVDLGERLGLFDFERAAKIAGARFCLSKGPGALLERALAAFMLDLHTREHGYTEVLAPLMVNSDSMQGTGQLPKFAEDLFRVQGGDYWLIPTAEVPVTNIHRDEMLDDAVLPVKYVAHTPCFRSEAGSYGKDTRGMIRQHQFNKVEMVQFTRPEESWDALESLTRNAEAVLQRLGLAYRVVTLCTGDMGFSSAKTYDLEVWLPGQNTYREISSCSNFTDFQARRANIRFKRGKKPEFVHTLNGSGLAVGRTAVAVLENGQRADGSIEIPPALRPYMGGMERIESK
ncbi:MAG: serine--tRNA ligase [Candidatus Hydrogenedentes bacterium]|nr:serine--tRNA ligase [Candidatus Hydrogenedentota bacterium]